MDSRCSEFEKQMLQILHPGCLAAVIITTAGRTAARLCAFIPSTAARMYIGQRRTMFPSAAPRIVHATGTWLSGEGIQSHLRSPRMVSAAP